MVYTRRFGVILTVKHDDKTTVHVTKNARHASKVFKEKYPELAAIVGGSFSSFRLLLCGRYPAPTHSRKKLALPDVVELQRCESEIPATRPAKKYSYPVQYIPKKSIYKAASNTKCDEIKNDVENA